MHKKKKKNKNKNIYDFGKNPWYSLQIFFQVDLQEIDQFFKQSNSF